MIKKQKKKKKKKVKIKFRQYYAITSLQTKGHVVCEKMCCQGRGTFFVFPWKHLERK